MKYILLIFISILIYSCKNAEEPIQSNKSWLSGVWYDSVSNPARCCPRYCIVNGDSVSIDCYTYFEPYGVNPTYEKTLKGKILSEKFNEKSLLIDVTPFSRYYQNGMLIPDSNKIKSIANIVFTNEFKFTMTITHTIPKFNSDSTQTFNFVYIYTK